jgi:hypothetical protein
MASLFSRNVAGAPAAVKGAFATLARLGKTGKLHSD